MCEVCSKFAINTSEPCQSRHSGAAIVNCGQISTFFCLSIVKFEQVIRDIFVRYLKNRNNRLLKIVGYSVEIIFTDMF